MRTIEVAVQVEAAAEGQEEAGVVEGLGRVGRVEEVQTTAKTANSVKAPAVVEDVVTVVDVEQGGGGKVLHDLHRPPGRLLHQTIYWTRTSFLVSLFCIIRLPIPNLAGPR